MTKNRTDPLLKVHSSSHPARVIADGTKFRATLSALGVSESGQLQSDECTAASRQRSRLRQHGSEGRPVVPSYRLSG